MTAERRAGDRLPILGGLRGEIMVFQPMLIKEIGPGGVTVETHVPLSLNSLHDLRLGLGERSVVVKGRVVRTEVSDAEAGSVTYRSGLEFTDVPDRVVEVIAEFLAELGMSEAPPH